MCVSGGGAETAGEVSEYTSYCARIHDEEIYHDLVKPRESTHRLAPAPNAVCFLFGFYFLNACLAAGSHLEQRKSRAELQKMQSDGATSGLELIRSRWVSEIRTKRGQFGAKGRYSVVVGSFPLNKFSLHAVNALQKPKVIAKY